jgi:hypothetical protein
MHNHARVQPITGMEIVVRPPTKWWATNRVHTYLPY